MKIRGPENNQKSVTSFGHVATVFLSDYVKFLGSKTAWYVYFNLDSRLFLVTRPFHADYSIPIPYCNLAPAFLSDYADQKLCFCILFRF